MDTFKKGQSKELLCRKELEANGWEIAFKSQRTRFGMVDLGIMKKDKEMNMLQARFDVWAIKDRKWLFVSVKHKSSYRPSEIYKIQKFKELYMPNDPAQGIIFQIWCWDSPRWKGRAPNKIWHRGGWEILNVI